MGVAAAHTHHVVTWLQNRIDVDLVHDHLEALGLTVLAADPPRNWRSRQASDGGAVGDRVFPYLSVVDHASAVRMHPGVSSRFRAAAARKH
jgi:hypothetical protein